MFVRAVGALVIMAAATPVVAITTSDFLKSVDAAVYTPATHGLRSLRVIYRDVVADQRFAQLQRLEIVLYWKAPDRRRARFEKGGREVHDRSLDFLLTDGIDMLAFIVPQPFASRNAVLLPEQSGGGATLRVFPAPWDPVQETRLFVFDHNFIPTSSKTDGPGGFRHTDTMEYDRSRSPVLLRRLVRTSVTDMGQSTTVFTVDYVDIQGFWVPSRFFLEQGAIRQTYLFRGYELNRRIDDSVFARAAGR